MPVAEVSEAQEGAEKEDEESLKQAEGEEIQVNESVPQLAEPELPELEVVEEPLLPSYGSKRYTIVDEVLKSVQIAEKRKASYCPIRAAAEIA